MQQNTHLCCSRCLTSSNSFIIKGSFVIEQTLGQASPGKSASVQIYSSTDIDPVTGRGRVSDKAQLSRGKSRKNEGTKSTTYRIKLKVQPGFGTPGAFSIQNLYKHEFFLRSATLETTEDRMIHFDCRSWVYPFKNTKSSRLFFSNKPYLPSETPGGLVQLRREELTSLRGDGTGETKESDRIYKYDVYNDLAIRPVLGGSDAYPYPRRGRTGSSHTRNESWRELIKSEINVPPDEQFSPKKMSELIGKTIQAASHFLAPESKNLFNDSRGFESLDDIYQLFSEKKTKNIDRKVSEKLKKMLPNELSKNIRNNYSKGEAIQFPLPQIVQENELAWIEDEEFGRQMLAGVNPTRIRNLEAFPPRGQYGESSIKQSDVEDKLDGLSLREAMNQWRMFILDHHDYLIPFLTRINSQPGVCAYASRTILFLRDDSTLKPVAIELSLPGQNNRETVSKVFLPASQGTERALWQLAKAHVAANDSVHHQLVTHWLNTHAVVEPFIIATRRQLSAMHPIHRLLDPHFKDTMHINAVARTLLVNSGGVLEKTLFSGKFSMELSSVLYKEWRFDEQAVPIDLLKRGMALEDKESPTGIKILFQDYPYGLDALDIWAAIKTWIHSFCDIFYKDDESVKSDTEVQAWWSEIRTVGHHDKCNETWWFEMTTSSQLKQALTILIWVTSALHASVNSGQYSYAGFPPNRPTLCRRFVPTEGTEEFAEFLCDPDKYFLKMLPDRFQMRLTMALMKVLVSHATDEVCLGETQSSDWSDDQQEVKGKFNELAENLKEIERKIVERNRDPRLKNRLGPAKIPYMLLCPNFTDDETLRGTTAKGIPNSISI